MLVSHHVSLSRFRFTLERGYPECATDNANGLLCGEHDSASVTPRDIAEDVITDCLATPGNCSDRCRTTLENFSGRFHCCIHSLDVTESNDLIRALTPQLWEDCGVTLPEPCDDEPLQLEPLALSPDVSCSYACTLHQWLALFCKYQANEVVRTYRECGSEELALQFIQTCGFNEREEFCGAEGGLGGLVSLFLGSSNELNDDYVTQIYDTCIGFMLTGKCSPECRDALVQARDTFGCCLNNINSTALGSLFSNINDIQNFVTSYDLWSVCVVEPSPLCQLPNKMSIYDRFTSCSLCEFQPTGSGSFPLVAVAGGAGAAGLILLILVALVPVAFYCCSRKRYHLG